MKRSLILFSACLSASLFVGCASNQQKEANQPVSQGYMPKGAVEPTLAKSDPFLSEKDPPVAAMTHFAAGQYAEAEGNYQVAAQQYEQACQVQPDYLWAEYRLGVVYSHMKNWPKAVEAWNAYIESTNGVASAYSNLGFTYELMGDWSRAEEAYKKGLDKDGTCQPCRVNYGLMLARRGRIPESVQQFQAVLTPAEIHYNLASVFEQQGRRKLAKAEYEMALKLDPQMHDAQTRMASINLAE
ncbi:MAG TPA: tetratricopeptide repeat protein [Tepidisphaeraceae bacterium]|jgi:tetratricopeptide (TPR) repeat protein